MRTFLKAVKSQNGLWHNGIAQLILCSSELHVALQLEEVLLTLCGYM